MTRQKVAEAPVEVEELGRWVPRHFEMMDLTCGKRPQQLFPSWVGKIKCRRSSYVAHPEEEFFMSKLEMGGSDPPGNEETYPTERVSARQIIDSKMAF